MKSEEPLSDQVLGQCGRQENRSIERGFVVSQAIAAQNGKRRSNIRVFAHLMIPNTDNLRLSFLED